jgi:NADH:ubiquinone oxidoreductase subunit 2 (subunit N)
MGEMIHVLPEWILVFGIFLALIVETGSGEDQRIRNVWITMGACFALGSVACVWQIFELATWAEPKQVFYGAIQMDGLAIYTKTLLFVLGLVGLGIAYWSREISHWIKPEQGILIGVVILSGSIMGAAQDLLIGYLAL